MSRSTISMYAGGFTEALGDVLNTYPRLKAADSWPRLRRGATGGIEQPPERVRAMNNQGRTLILNILGWAIHRLCRYPVTTMVHDDMQPIR